MIIDQAITVLAQDLDLKAILLYGSYAQNMQDEKSDFDLLVILKTIPLPNARQNTYKKIPHAKIVEIAPSTLQLCNGWDNSWSPINDKLLIHSKKVEIGYNTTAWVNCVVKKLIVKHQITFKEFPFRPYTFLGLLESCKILYDKKHFVQKIRSQIKPIPQALKETIIEEFFPILLEAHEELKDYSARNIGILAYQFHLFRGIDALIQILFAYNDVYDPAFKRMEPFLFKLKKLPPHLESFVLNVLPRFFEKQKEISQFLEEAIQFVRRLSITKIKLCQKAEQGSAK